MSSGNRWAWVVASGLLLLADCGDSSGEPGGNDGGGTDGGAGDGETPSTCSAGALREQETRDLGPLPGNVRTHAPVP